MRVFAAAVQVYVVLGEEELELLLVFDTDAARVPCFCQIFKLLNLVKVGPIREIPVP